MTVWDNIRKEESQPDGKVEHGANIACSKDEVEASTDLVEYTPIPKRNVNVNRRIKVRKFLFVRSENFGS